MQGLVNLLTQRFHVKDRNGTVERPNQLGNRPRKAASIFLCAQHQELEIPVFPPGRGKVEKIRCLFAEIVVLGVGHDADNFHRRAISFHESESFTKGTFPAEIMPRHRAVDDGRRSGSWSVMVSEIAARKQRYAHGLEISWGVAGELLFRPYFLRISLPATI